MQTTGSFPMQQTSQPNHHRILLGNPAWESLGRSPMVACGEGKDPTFKTQLMMWWCGFFFLLVSHCPAHMLPVPRRHRKQGPAWSCTSKSLPLLRYPPRDKVRASFQPRSEKECCGLKAWCLWYHLGFKTRARTETPHVRISDRSFQPPAELPRGAGSAC